MTENFTLKELTKSYTATRLGFDEQFLPSLMIIENLELLAENILQPLRDEVGHAIHVHSGYRCRKLNEYIGGAKRSQHMLGQAVDIEDYKMGNKYLWDKILEMYLPFDQLINEFDYSWIHVSYSDRHRRQKLRAYREDGKTIYQLI